MAATARKSHCHSNKSLSLTVEGLRDKGGVGDLKPGVLFFGCETWREGWDVLKEECASFVRDVSFRIHASVHVCTAFFEGRKEMLNLF